MAGKMTATMVVDLQDKTGAGVRAVIGNLDRLKRAERELELAQRGARLSRKDQAMENLLVARHQAAQERKAQMMMWAGRAATAGAAMVAGQVASFSAYADAERRINRIAVTADKGFSTVGGTMRQLHKAADDAYMPIDKVTEGIEALVASGRSMEDSLAFLPSVTMTAQAAGAEVADIGRSADSMAGSLGIKANEMQHAFDILVAGGKAGKFELKDMAQYLPSLLPAFSALGYKGTEGLEKMVSMLQIVRNQSGSAGEAATYLGNVFQKMETEETTKKFRKMGVDLTKSMKDARKSGKDVLEVFLDLTMKATKGDLSKIPLLFGDAEMQKGVRALLMQRDALREMNQSLKNVDGATLRDFNQIAQDSASKLQHLNNQLEQLALNAGKRIAPIANPLLEKVNQILSDRSALDDADAGLDPRQKYERERDFRERYSKLNPSAGDDEVNEAYKKALLKVGHGEMKSVVDDLKMQEAYAAYGQQTGAYPSRGAYDPAAHAAGVAKQPLGRQTGEIPLPIPRPASETAAEREMRLLQEAEETTRAYPSRGRYQVASKPEDMSWWRSGLKAAGDAADRFGDRMRGGMTPEEYRDYHTWSNEDPNYPVLRRIKEMENQPPPPTPDATPVAASMAVEEAGIRERERLARQRRIRLAAGIPGTTDTLPGKAADDVDMGRAAPAQGPQTVTLSGTPAVSVSGPITIANPPQPNVFNMSFVINEASDAQAVAQAVGQHLQSAASGVQASTGHFGN